MKPLFIQGPSITTRLVVLAILSILMMSVDHRQHHLEGIRGTLSLLVYPLQFIVNLPVAASNWVGESLASRETLQTQNARLEMQQTLYKAKLLKLQSLTAENLRLRELLQSSKKFNERVLIGELLSVDLEPFTRQVVINKGSRHEVYLGQPLMDAEGAMGQIVHLGPFSSTAMLITDANHAIPVQVNRNGLRAIALGTGAPDRLDLPYLPISADIVEGDLLTTSGLGGRFPPGYPVAMVTSVHKDPTLPYAVISAVPTAQLEQSREVLLVWHDQTPDQADPAGDTAAGANPP
ncbi:MAG: rod shape-determining protein MreC [Gammaproteobacteria bacterium]|nr:rod shape-determining protein MreC [Gammaproteobacteria bacterium]